MRPSAIIPTGKERPFHEDEIIVSKTDTQGRIRYANDVFVRVSAYTEEELMGQPHNIIRHPDMPRAVFKLLWDTISSGHELFAYINNLAQDGGHYWVFAHVTPSFDTTGRITGYHSNRRVPDRAALSEAQQVYQLLLNEERRHSNTSQAVAASTELLTDMLNQLKMPYEQWVWSINPAHQAPALPVTRPTRGRLAGAAR